jgi:hypothetical protein
VHEDEKMNSATDDEEGQSKPAGAKGNGKTKGKATTKTDEAKKEEASGKPARGTRGAKAAEVADEPSAAAEPTRSSARARRGTAASAAAAAADVTAAAVSCTAAGKRRVSKRTARDDDADVGEKQKTKADQMDDEDAAEEEASEGDDGSDAASVSSRGVGAKRVRKNNEEAPAECSPPEKGLLRPSQVQPMFPSASGGGLPSALAFAVLDLLPLRSLVTDVGRVSTGWHDALIRYAVEKIHAGPSEQEEDVFATARPSDSAAAAAAGGGKRRGAAAAAATNKASAKSPAAAAANVAVILPVPLPRRFDMLTISPTSTPRKLASLTSSPLRVLVSGLTCMDPIDVGLLELVSLTMPHLCSLVLTVSSGAAGSARFVFPGAQLTSLQLSLLFKGHSI